MRDLERQPYNSVLIVTHGFITKAILSYVENRTIDVASDFQLPKGTYVEFEIIKKIWNSRPSISCLDSASEG